VSRKLAKRVNFESAAVRRIYPATSVGGYGSAAASPHRGPFPTGTCVRFDPRLWPSGFPGTGLHGWCATGLELMMTTDSFLINGHIADDPGTIAEVHSSLLGFTR